MVWRDRIHALAGYRDDSLETVKRNEQQYQIPLEVVSYKQLYGWTMDEIVKEIGTKNNCTFCGVFRRQALDRGATKMKVHPFAPLSPLLPSPAALLGFCRDKQQSTCLLC